MELYQPWMLTTLLVIPALYMVFKRRRNPSVVIPDAAPAKRLKHRRKLTLLEYCVLIALLLLSVALARPRQSITTSKIRAKGLDIILAIDLSGSMQAYDKSPKMSRQEFVEGIRSGTVLDRLETAKAEIRRFIELRPNDRIGLIGFADLAYSFVPPTLDHSLLLSRLKGLKYGELGEMTGIASPIGLAAERLKKSTAPRRVLVLFTDGANTAANKFTPMQAAEIARELNIIIHTVGIGGEEAYGIVNTFSGQQLSRLEGGFDAKLLTDLAKLTGGTTFRAADAENMRKTMQEINSLEKTNIEQPRPIYYREFAPLLALAALAVMLVGMLSYATWQLRLP